MSIEEVEERLNRWLYMLISIEGADLHIKSNSPLYTRLKSDIVQLPKKVSDDKLLKELVVFLTHDSYEAFDRKKEYDGAYKLDE